MYYQPFWIGAQDHAPHLHAPPLDPPTVSITYWDYLIHTLDNCHLPFKEINVMATPPSLHVFPLFRWILKSTIVLSLRGQWLDFQSLVSMPPPPPERWDFRLTDMHPPRPIGLFGFAFVAVGIKPRSSFKHPPVEPHSQP